MTLIANKKGAYEMIEFIFYQMMCVLYAGAYFFVAMHGTKKIYIFFGISELLLVLFFVKAFISNDENALAIIVLQIGLLFIIKAHNKNKQRNEIYNMMSFSDYTVVIFSGIRNLSDNEYKRLRITLIKTFGKKINFVGKVCLFLSYEDNKLTIRYIFNKSQDYEIYAKEMQGMQIIEEAEYIGNGVSLVCQYSI